MALFKKSDPKRSKVDNLLDLIDSLSAEEFEEFLKRAELEEEDGDEKKDTSEEIKEAEADIKEKGADTQTVKDRIDESVAAQEKDEDEEDTQTAKDRVDEAMGEDKAIKKYGKEKPEEVPTEDKLNNEEKEQEAMRAIEARLDEIEERIANIVEKIDDSKFGNYGSEVTEQDADGETDDSRIMKSYMRKQAYRK